MMWIHSATAVVDAVLWVGALVLAIARWRRHPTVSMLLVVSSIIALTTLAASTVVPWLMSQSGTGLEKMELAFSGISLVRMVGLALTLMAVFADRAGDGAGPPATRW